MSLRRVSAFGALLAIAACGIYGRSEDSPAPVTDAGDPNDGGSSGDAGAAPTAAIHGFSKRARIGDDNADIARPPNTQTGDLLLLFGYGAGAVTIDGFTSVGTRTMVDRPCDSRAVRARGCSLGW